MKSRGLSGLWARRIWVIVSLVIFLWGCQPASLFGGDASLRPGSMSVRVARVVSGQTIEVINPANQQAERVRLLGIETPAQKQEPWYSQAKERLQTLLGDDSVVILETDVEPEAATDSGSVLKLAYVWKNGVLLNEQLVAEGVVLASSRSPNLRYEQRLINAQEKARLMGIGIWNAEHPMRQMPQEFRTTDP
ncbi:thermonuclease family protein [Oscillatoria sp. FACHB-1407]|uniref:thermonuclease family protein n=1 Tax=Oscillatoria sp. FACHB-1407 TaxID=2692847 RepID=UPI00168527E0|nr:thermonuclease family protein [Oscillatoria sp. FACHB-1407]MBD2465451.1 thermonuclease family protein [Oscillatoria sp. FACHB-1407]